MVEVCFHFWVYVIGKAQVGPLTEVPPVLEWKGWQLLNKAGCRLAGTETLFHCWNINIKLIFKQGWKRLLKKGRKINEYQQYLNSHSKELISSISTFPLYSAFWLRAKALSAAPGSLTQLEIQTVSRGKPRQPNHCSVFTLGERIAPSFWASIW